MVRLNILRGSSFIRIESSLSVFLNYVFFAPKSTPVEPRLQYYAEGTGTLRLKHAQSELREAKHSLGSETQGLSGQKPRLREGEDKAGPEQGRQ